MTEHKQNTMENLKENLTNYQKRYLADLRKHLNNLESLGKSGSAEWWEISETIDAIENNL